MKYYRLFFPVVCLGLGGLLATGWRSPGVLISHSEVENIRGTCGEKVTGTETVCYPGCAGCGCGTRQKIMNITYLLHQPAIPCASSSLCTAIFNLQDQECF